MNTCKTCKHWKPSDKYEIGHGLGIGVCQNVPMFWNVTEWNARGEARKLSKQFARHKAFVQDGSDYKAWFLTLPDFGCVSYEQED